jgi:hypothetical protein
MKIMIVGDVHGEFGTLNTLINRRKPDMIIACGDFGYWPKFKGFTVNDIKLQGAKMLMWCDGNHEDFWSLKDRDSDEIAPGIFYMPRGSTYTLPDGRVIMFMGGAHSIDKNMRTVGIDWFPEETITQSDIYKLPDIDVDIFITHTCPAELVPIMVKDRFSGKDYEPSNKALSHLWELYKPDLWYFGHWHYFKQGILHNKTKWTALSAARWFTDRWWLWLPEKGEK